MPAPAASEQDVLDRIEAAPILARTEAWSRINSGSTNLPGLAIMAGLLADACASLPGDVRLADGLPVETLDGEGRRRELERGRVLLATIRPDAPVQVLLSGHMDTVYAADHPFQVPRWLDGERLNGPGVADMKGGLAVMLAAVEAVERDPTAAARLGYRIVINADEEVGSQASSPLLAEAARGAHAAFAYEPALADGTLAGARPGSGNLSFAVHGRAAHAGRNPQDGRNAVVAAADLALRLADAAGDELTVNPARIEGGGPNNIVPELAVLRTNLRPRDAKAQSRAEAAIREAVAAVAVRHDVRIEQAGGFARPPKPVDAGAERLFALVGRAARDLGFAAERRDTGGVCDGNLIAAAHVPVVDTMGVRGGAIHTADEFLLASSVAERARLSALCLLRLAECGL